MCVLRLPTEVDHQTYLGSFGRAVGGALGIVACTACLSTPKRPAPGDGQPNSACGAPVQGMLSDGGAFGAGMLDGQPIVVDLNNDHRDDLILWGREPVGDVMCLRVWIFYGSGTFTSLTHYDRRIDFATAIHAVSVANSSSDNADLNLMVLVQNDGNDLLARFDFAQSAADPIIAPAWPSKISAPGLMCFSGYTPRMSTSAVRCATLSTLPNRRRASSRSIPLPATGPTSWRQTATRQLGISLQCLKIKRFGACQRV